MYHICGTNFWSPIPAARVEEDGGAVRLRRGLTRVDRELEKGNYREALSLVKQLKRSPHHGLRAFGLVKLVPNRILEMDEVEYSKMISASSPPGHPSLIDRVMHSIDCCRRFSLQENEVVSSELVGSVDYEADNSPSEDYFMCLQHEAGHFLVGYLLGLLPKRYKVPSMQELVKDNFAGGKVEFLGFEFLSEIDIADTSNKNRKNTKGKLSNETFNRFLCVIVSGLVAEHLLFGYSDLLHSDVAKLDNVLKWLDLTEDEAYFKVRYAALNSIAILSIHDHARSKLAEAMASQGSISFCIHTVENSLK